MSRSSSTVYVTLTGYIHAETEKAVLFETTEISGYSIADPKKEWFPISQISRIIRASKQANPGTREAMDEIVVAEWLCEKKGLM